MVKIKELIQKLRAYKQKRHAKVVEDRANEIFTIEEYEGSVWFFCNNVGMFPCSFVNLKSEEEIIAFLQSLRKFYMDTER